MTVQELAARNRAAKLAQLDRLRPAYHTAKAAEDAIYSARKDAKGLRSGHELMSKLKFIPGFFPTPADVVSRMIESADLFPGCVVLEPSAGKGNIALEVLKRGAHVTCVERNHQLAEHLRSLSQKWEVLCADFMECFDREACGVCLPVAVFDRILMNPPFENRQDVAHIKHAHQFLKRGGRLVAIASSTGASILEPWVSERGGTVEPLPAGSFRTSERPTGVNCSMIVI